MQFCFGGLVPSFIYSSKHSFCVHAFMPSCVHVLTVDSLFHRFIGSLVGWFIESLLRWFFDSLFHWFIGSSIYWFIVSFTHLCADSFMSFHWHLNHHLLLCWCTSQLQPLMVSAPQKRSYRPSPIFETSAPAHAGHYLAFLLLLRSWDLSWAMVVGNLHGFRCITVITVLTPPPKRQPKN